MKYPCNLNQAEAAEYKRPDMQESNSSPHWLDTSNRIAKPGKIPEWYRLSIFVSFTGLTQ
jgi:hypothetical protein